jgi:phosphatidylserine/phosphatidylglycerophosphate/cardiolipin synthase-like enzyme
MDPDATDWFLLADQRGNPATAIDAGRAPRAWTTGNHAEVLVDGDAYLRCLQQTLETARRGDRLLLAGLEMDADLLLGGGVRLGGLLAALLARGVEVRGLVWRSHPNYTAGRNLEFARVVNAAGGDVRLDNRIRSLGSIHQKIVVLLRADPDADDVAFVGGIDLSRGNHDDAAHRGDPQRANLSAANYGDRPPWHDIQVELRGPVVEDVAFSFAERWNDPTALDRRVPWRHLIQRLVHQRAAHSELALARRTGAPRAPGPYAMQVLRTYPARRRPFPFAPQGERSIARAYLHAFSRARRLVYLEDQYLWSYAAAAALVDALWREPELRVVIVMPRFPDPAGWISGPASAIGRRNVMRALAAAGGPRVAVYDLVNDDDVPIYVHSKVCIIDDAWLAVGSDNLNRRSWSHDTEISCTIVEPDAGRRGPGLAADTRMRLAAEHLELDDPREVLDPAAWFDAFSSRAAAARAWVDGGRVGPRPPGRVRVHAPDGVGHLPHLLLHAAHNLVLDPDGRPGVLRRADRY